jgi:hypothetical protein
MARMLNEQQSETKASKIILDIKDNPDSTTEYFLDQDGLLYYQ